MPWQCHGTATAVPWECRSSDMAMQCLHVFDGIPIKHVLKASAQEAMNIMAQRLGTSDVICPCSDVLLQVDEAVQVLDKHDHAVLVQEQRDADWGLVSECDGVETFPVRVRPRWPADEEGGARRSP